MSTHTIKRRSVAAAAVSLSLLAAATPAVATHFQPAQGASNAALTAEADPVHDWFLVTKAAVAKANVPVALPQAPQSAIWATTWLAADRALDGSPSHGRGSDVAAFAQAAHDTLTSLVPSATGDVDAALATTLADIPDGVAKSRGIARGAAAAADVIDERTGDGLTLADVNTQPYTPPVGAGYWVPTTIGGKAIQQGLGDAKPYLVENAAKLKVPAPPALGTPAYRADLNEVRLYGAAAGSLRSQSQTDVAQFWAQSSLNAYTQVLDVVLGRLDEQHASLERRVHLVAVFHEATTDAQIAIFKNKYIYNGWRPLTAIREADLDGNAISDNDPLTVPDPTWTSLITSPLHPQYPGGHSGYAGAAAVVLRSLVGKPAAQVVIGSSTAPAGTTRSYTSWDQLTQENVDGRVWEGVHFRSSDVAGAKLGATVGKLAVARDARHH